MDIHLSLRHGPLEVEIDANNSDEYQEELLNMLKFIEEHESRLLELEAPETDSDGQAANEEGDSEIRQASMRHFEGEVSAHQDKNESVAGTNGGTAIDDSIASLAKKVNASADDIRDIVDIDPEGEEPPFLLIDVDELAKTKTRRQFIGALILLTAWDECYKADQMKSSTLKDALEYSEIAPSNMSNMYNLDDADSAFNRSGMGRNAKIELTRPGKRKAHNQLRELLGD